MLSKDYNPAYAEEPPSARRPSGEPILSRAKNKEAEELCQCPCHSEGLECNSCHVVACRTLIFEAELKRVLARG